MVGAGEERFFLTRLGLPYLITEVFHKHHILIAVVNFAELLPIVPLLPLFDFRQYATESVHADGEKMPNLFGMQCIKYSLRISGRNAK